MLNSLPQDLIVYIASFMSVSYRLALKEVCRGSLFLNIHFKANPEQEENYLGVDGHVAKWDTIQFFDFLFQHKWQPWKDFWVDLTEEAFGQVETPEGKAIMAAVRPIFYTAIKYPYLLTSELYFRVPATTFYEGHGDDISEEYYALYHAGCALPPDEDIPELLTRGMGAVYFFINYLGYKVSKSKD